MSELHRLEVTYITEGTMIVRVRDGADPMKSGNWDDILAEDVSTELTLHDITGSEPTDSEEL